MKRPGLLLLLVILLSISLFGCQKSENKTTDQTTIQSEENNETVEKTDKQKDTMEQNRIIQATSVDPRVDTMTKLCSNTFDIDKDGVEENIELYTAAGRLPDGTMAWDDGQNWLLMIESGDQYYPLFQQYVQLGSVYYIVLLDDQEAFVVTTFINTGAGLSVINYTFNSDDNSFVEEIVYDSGVIDLIYSSFLGY